MKNLKLLLKKFSKSQLIKFGIIFLCITALLTIYCYSNKIKNDKENTPMVFWAKQRKGANIFNKNILRRDIRAAKLYGIQFVRLAFDKFSTSRKDFLLGDADQYNGLVKEDLEKVKSILDICAEEGMPVILTVLSLPGARWRQNSVSNRLDLRLWSDKKFQYQAALFWQDLAKELKNYSIIIGYNLLNEPCVDRLFNPSGEIIGVAHQDKIQSTLNSVYQLIITSVRTVNPTIPIILDSSGYADAQTFKYFIPLEDPNIIYSFHIYEPYEYTNYKMNQGKFCYPGEIGGSHWDKDKLKKYMEYVVRFQKLYKIPSHRILVGEFGANRKSKGIEKYFSDLIAIFNEQDWHFAFYAFREDCWDGMDYELGDKNLPYSYWKAIEKEEAPLERQDTSLSFQVLKETLK